MKIRTLFFIFAIFFSGCVTVETCDEDNESELVALLKTVKDGITIDSTVTSLTLYGIREGRTDSLLYNSLPTSGFIVPLNPQPGFSQFVLSIDDLTDTLTIHHRHERYMISYTCGFGNLFTIEKIEHSFTIFNKDSIISTLVDEVYEDDEEHIWLYL